MAQKIILDTDIGDDIDDALALALICASPELDLIGVTTVYGNVVARARQARTILKLVGGRATSVPVAAGCGAALSLRATSGTKQYLENQLPNQDPTCLPEHELPPLDPRHGVDLIIESIMKGDGDIIPVTIGALTNLAVALTKERRIAAKIPKIVAMAAEFKAHTAEWNIRCDPEAAAIVFASGIPVEVVTWEMGNLVRFDQPHLDRLNASSRPVALNLARSITTWQAACRAWGAVNPMPSLYDPLAVAALYRPQLMTWKRGTVTVELRGDTTYGFTTLAEDAAGPHQVAWTVEREPALDLYMDRVLA